MICPKPECKKTIPDESKFSSYCGNKKLDSDGSQTEHNGKKVTAPRLLVGMQYLFITLTALAVIYNFYHGIWEGVMIAVVTLILFCLPVIFSSKGKIVIPVSFQIFIMLFIFASMYLGEMRGYFYRYDWWDVMLHSISAVVLGYIGFVLIYALNRDRNIHLKLSPFFIALFSFCFAMTVGVVWEIFEFAVDEFLGYNMQKARDLELVYGEFDTRLGVIDTMKDLIMNTIGALFVSIVGYFYCRKKERKNSTFGRLKDEFIKYNPKLFNNKTY